MSCTQLIIIIVCACVMLLCMNYHGMYNFIIIIWCACIMLLSLPALHQEGEATTTCSCNTDCHNQPFVAANCNNVGQDDWYIMFGLLLKMRIYESCVYIYIYVLASQCTAHQEVVRAYGRHANTCGLTSTVALWVSKECLHSYCLGHHDWKECLHSCPPPAAQALSFLHRQSAASSGLSSAQGALAPGVGNIFSTYCYLDVFGVRVFYLLLSSCFWCSLFSSACRLAKSSKR